MQGPPIKYTLVSYLILITKKAKNTWCNSMYEPPKKYTLVSKLILSSKKAKRNFMEFNFRAPWKVYPHVQTNPKFKKGKKTLYLIQCKSPLKSIISFFRIGIHCPLQITTERFGIKTRGGYKIFLGGSIGLVYLKTPLMID